MNFEIEQKSKNIYTNVLSANVKGNLKSILDTFFEDYDIRKNINKEEVINVKVDIATNPIKGGTYCFKIVDLPEMFQVRTYDLPSLFADKICACLVRGWKTRVKGRDYFDFAFFIRRKVKVNMSYLRKLLIGSKLIDSNTEFNINVLKSMLIEKFNSLNYEAAKADISVYIKNQNLISLWSKEFFIDLTENLSD